MGINVYCNECGSNNIELHHRVFRSENKQLVNCRANHVWLCTYHHRGGEGVHGKNGRKLNLKLKIEFQQWLEENIESDSVTEQELRDTLGITEREVRSLLKTVTSYGGIYLKEDVIRACMGGKIYG